MKKKMAKILSIFLTLALCFTLFACRKEDNPPENEGVGGDTLTLVIEGEVLSEYTVPTASLSDEGGVISVLDYLKSLGALEYSMNGTMLSRVGELTDGEGGKYIFIFTDLEANHDVSQWAKTVEYRGKTLTSSGFGAADTAVSAGMVIYITLVSF